MEKAFEPASLRVVACPHPFSGMRVERTVLEGMTIRQIMDELALRGEHLHARVFIDDCVIPQAEWEFAMPKAGQCVTVRVVPTGGGGGGGKDVLRLVAMIAVIAVAAWVTGGGASSLFTAEGLAMAFGSGTTAAAVAGGMIAIGGTLAMTAHIPPPLPRRTLPQPMPQSQLQEAA